MFEIMTALHLLFAIFIIGPLAHATTTAVRGLRTGSAEATATAARNTRVYAYASVLVVLFGFALMSSTSPYTGEAVAKFSETWIWLSTLLWLLGVAIALVVTAPALAQATRRLTDGQAVDSLSARIAASGGVIGLVFAVIVFLMVYRPGG